MYEFAPIPGEIPVDELYELYRDWACDDEGEWY